MASAKASVKVYVTGSTGLLGGNAVRLLLDHGHEVVAMYRDPAKAERLLGGLDVERVHGDMRDVDAFADALRGCDAVFHTAAYFREYYQPGNHDDSLRAINIDGTIALMEAAAARGVGRFVHVGSSGAIGRKDDGSPGDEETPPSKAQLDNAYFRSKHEGNAEIRAWISAHPHLEMIVSEILPGWMWGPFDAAPTNAGQLALDFLAGKIPGILEGGTSVVDARDVAEAMIIALDRADHGERYIVGGHYHALAEIFAALEAASGVPAPTRRIPHAAAVTYAFFAEIWGRVRGKPVTVSREGLAAMRHAHEVTSAKAERELGATFRPLEETMRDVVQWYRDNGYVTAANRGTLAHASHQR